jgi:hypothetical protein
MMHRALRISVLLCAWCASSVAADAENADAIAAEFALVRKLARDFYIGNVPSRTSQIRSAHLEEIEGPPPNSRGIESLANVTLRLAGNSVARIQLYEKAGRWIAVRDLGVDALPEAHPQLVDEFREPYWRETRRLEKRMAMDLESRLRHEGKLREVIASYPRCFVALKFDKALCDISYETWASDEPECFDTAVLFTRIRGDWIRTAGRYHPGMRVNPDSGAIYEMLPREPCVGR